MLFWMLWLLITVNKPCQVPQASCIITWGTILIELFFCVQGMGQILVTRLQAKLTPSKNCARNKENKKKKEWQLHSDFVLHANATTKICKRIMTRKEIKRKLTGGNTILFINEYEDFLWRFWGEDTSFAWFLRITRISWLYCTNQSFFLLKVFLHGAQTMIYIKY